MQTESMDVSTAHLGTTSVVNVRLHPMVILNISEHWTRYKMTNENDSIPIKVHGVLLGKQDGNQLEIVTSLELLLDSETNLIDTGFFKIRESQSKQVHPRLDFVGCYVTGGSITEEDHAFHVQMQEMCESIVILKLDPYQRRGDQLPIRIYESVVDGEARLHFKIVQYELAHDEAERIGVDHVAKSVGSSSSTSSSLTAEQLVGSYHAMEMLLKRINILQDYVLAVQENKIAPNHSILREISAITHRLPFLMDNGTDRSSEAFKTQLYRQANEVCLTVLLSSMTQGLHTLHSTLIKTLQILDKKPVLHHQSAHVGMGQSFSAWNSSNQVTSGRSAKRFTMRSKNTID